MEFRAAGLQRTANAPATFSTAVSRHTPTTPISGINSVQASNAPRNAPTKSAV